jgi:hypothetical protein
MEEVAYSGDLTSTFSTSCAAVTWRVGGGSSRQPVERDDALEAALRAFAERSARDMQWIEHALEQSLAGHEGYVMWGIGEAAFKLLALPPLSSRSAIAYADSNVSRQRFRFDGDPVRSPRQIESGAVPIVIGSLMQADSIAKAASDLDLENPVVRLDGWQGAVEDGDAKSGLLMSSERPPA